VFTVVSAAQQQQQQQPAGMQQASVLLRVKLHAVCVRHCDCWLLLLVPPGE